MSLIENLDHPSWREFLAGTFATTLNGLEQDRHRPVGNSADDLRAWLCAGGLPYARTRLDDQASQRRFTNEHRAEIVAMFDDLASQNSSRIVRLTASGVLPAPKGLALRAGLPTAADIADCLSRLAAGERPFKDWMRAHGRTDAEIAAVYAVIDEWFAARLRDPSSNGERHIGVIEHAASGCYTR